MLITLEEAAKLCGCSPESFLRDGPPPVRKGATPLWDAEVVQRWVDQFFHDIEALKWDDEDSGPEEP